MITRKLLAAATLLLPSSAFATTYNVADIIFETETRQSAWGPGDAAAVSDTIFLGPDPWNENLPFGKIVGGPTTISVPNPLYAAWVLCDKIPFVDCGSTPSKNLSTTIDTTTGVEASVYTTGRAGLEFEYVLDAGSVGASLNYSASAEVTEQKLEAGKQFSLNTSSALASGSLDSQSPTAEATLDVVADVVLGASVRGCIAGACKSDDKELISITDYRAELLAIDPNEITYLDGFLPDGVELTTPLLGQSTSLEADLVTKKLDINFGVNNDSQSVVDSAEPSSGVFSELARLDAQAPILELAGTADANGEIHVDGTADFLSLQADIDGLLSYVGVLPPLGARVDLLGYLSGSLDVIDIETGPTLGVYQAFSLTQALMVDIEFSEEVDIAGIGLTDSWTGLWDELPDLSIFEDTLLTPTFWTDVTLLSETGLDFGLDFALDILKGNLNISAGGFTVLDGDFGPVAKLGLDDPISLARISIFDDEFALGGFNSHRGPQIALALAPIVPLPAGIWMMFGSLGALAGLRRVASRRART